MPGSDGWPQARLALSPRWLANRHPYRSVILAASPEPQARDPAPFHTIRLPDGGRILLPIAAGAELVCQVAETVARVGARREDASC